MQRPFSSGSRSAPDPYDNFLEQSGFYRKHTARDSSCLFRAISEQMYDTQNYHLSIRKSSVDYMRKHREWFEPRIEIDLDEYLDEMSKPKTFGTLVELQAMSYMYQRNVILFRPMDLGSLWIFEVNFSNTFQIFVSPDSHFDTVFTTSFIKDAALCQSICYEILYKRVFKLPDVSFAVERMLYAASFEDVVIDELYDGLYCRRILLNDGRCFDFETPESTNCILDNHHLCHFHNSDFLIFVENLQLSEDQNHLSRYSGGTTTNNNSSNSSCVNENARKTSDSLLPEKYVSCVRQLLAEGITPFPYKVAKALDPDMYRNIEFDSWSEIRKEQRFHNWYTGGNNLQVGVKCQVHLRKTNEYLTGYIQEINGNDSTVTITQENCNGPCVVFIEQLGEKLIVPFECLKPLPSDQIKPWALPYRLQKHLEKNPNAISSASKLLKQFHHQSNMKYKMMEYNVTTFDSYDYSDSYSDKDESHYKLKQQFCSYDHFSPMGSQYEIIAMPLSVEKSPINRNGNASQVDSEKKQKEQQSTNETATNTITEIQNSGVQLNNVSSNLIASETSNHFQPFPYPEPFGYNYQYANNIIHPGPPNPQYSIYPGYQQPIYMQNPSDCYLMAGCYSVPVSNATGTSVRRCGGGINYSASKSIMENGDDLPIDVSTLRFFFNLGLDYYHEMTLKQTPNENPINDSINKLSTEVQKIKIESDSNNNNIIQNKKDNNNNNSNSNYSNNETTRHDVNQYQHQNKTRYPTKYFSSNSRRGGGYRGGAGNMNHNSRYSNSFNNQKNFGKNDNRSNRGNNDDQRSNEHHGRNANNANSNVVEQRIQTSPFPTDESENTQTITTYQAAVPVPSTYQSFNNFPNDNSEHLATIPPPMLSNSTATNAGVYLPQVMPITFGPAPPLSAAQIPYQYMTSAPVQPTNPGISPYTQPPPLTSHATQSYYFPQNPIPNELISTPETIMNYPLYFSPNQTSCQPGNLGQQNFWYATAPPGSQQQYHQQHFSQTTPVNSGKINNATPIIPH